VCRREGKKKANRAGSAYSTRGKESERKMSRPRKKINELIPKTQEGPSGRKEQGLRNLDFTTNSHVGKEKVTGDARILLENRWWDEGETSMKTGKIKRRKISDRR